MGAIDFGFLQGFFGPHGMLIAVATVFIIGVVSLAIGVVRYSSDKIKQAERDRLGSEIQTRLDFYETGTAALTLAQQELERQKNEIETREQALSNVRTALTGKEHELWRLHDARKPADYDDRMKRLRATPVIMVANLKSGVGKTTLAANLAASLSASGKRVLIVDVDERGSLSTMLLAADECQHFPAGVKTLLDPGASSPALANAMHSFAKTMNGSALVPAGHDLAAVENRLTIEYLLREDADDGRYRLAGLLAGEMSAGRFDIALIDTPPHLTAGAINAFCASTHLLVPTVYDDASAEAVAAFLHGAHVLKEALNPSIDLLGIVGMLTEQPAGLAAHEQTSKGEAVEQVIHAWSSDQHFFTRHIPRRTAIAAAAGHAIAYFADPEVRGIFDELGREVVERLTVRPSDEPAEQPRRSLDLSRPSRAS